VPCGHRNLGGQVGGTMVWHTWDQTLGAHCHVHCVSAAGALASNGARWSAAAPRCLFPVRALSTVLRGTCCAALAQASATGAVPLPEGFAQLRAQLYAHEGGVYATAPFAGPAQGLDSVGRSTPRVAIAHHRRLDVRAGCVRFAYRTRRQGHRVQPLTRDADACIRRFLVQGFPRGCMRLRPDGFLANRPKARTLRRGRERLGQPSEPPPRRAKSGVEWMQEVTGIDRTPCPHGGARPLLRLPLAPLAPPGGSRGTPVEVPIYDSS
jgi:Putative transposase